MAKKTKKQKTSTTFMGLPMQWDYKNIGKDVWNPSDKRVFPPRKFGIGWTVNLHAVCKKAGLV